MTQARLAHVVRGLALMLLLAPAILAACSSSDNAASKPNASSDTAFVTGLCNAAKSFGDDVQKSLAGPTPTDLGAAFAAFFESIGPALQRFSDTFAKLTPPADLNEWHRESAEKLATAAKALKDGKFDDPSLDSLSQSPIPDMPEDARTRLKAVAAKVDACKDQPIFADPASNTNGGFSAFGGSGTPTPALNDAATGTWTGDFGKLIFNSDGSARFQLTACGFSSTSTAPFGIDHDCSGQDYTGGVKVGKNEYTLTQPGGGGSVFAAFVDKGGKLHVGVGSITSFPAGRKGTIQPFASSPITVDGDSCTTSSFGSKTPTKIECAWKTRDGHEIVEFDDGFGGKDFMVIDREDNLAVSPEVFAATFGRAK